MHDRASKQNLTIQIMKLAFSSNAYMNFSIEETIARIADCGYGGIEILADVPHAWPAGLLEQSKESIRTTLAEHKLAISNINAFMMNAVADPRQPYWHPGWTDPDPHYRAIRREHTKRCLKFADDIGAPNITTEPGGLLTKQQTWQEGANIFYEELMPCVELAEQLDIDLLIEPEPELLIETFGQYLEFVERIDSPRLGLNFDIGHAYCVGEDPQDWIAEMQPHTRHYHFEDIAASRKHAHLIPGHGAIDFLTTLLEIKKTKYNGWITVELYPYIDNPDQAAQEAHTYLQESMNQLDIPLH
jgi:sugar phosphate isomerase/epimerase